MQNPFLPELFPPSSPPRPLDPNGINVYGELPFMMNALNAANAKFFRNREAAYALFRAGNGIYHTGISFGSNLHTGIPVPKDTMAIVHTHPPGQAEPEPGNEDRRSKYPNYVFSGGRLYVTDPKTQKYYKYDIDKWNHPVVNAFLDSQK